MLPLVAGRCASLGSLSFGLSLLDCPWLLSCVLAKYASGFSCVFSSLILESTRIWLTPAAEDFSVFIIAAVI